MQRRQHEADFGALSAPGAATSTSIDVIVVSADDALIATLQQAAGAQHTLWHARGMARFVRKHPETLARL